MQSLFTAVLVILILLVLLVVFAPAWLEKRALLNRARRTQYAAEHEALERDSRRLKRTLAPYHRTQSALYRSQTAAAGARIADLDGYLTPLAESLAQLRCPEPFNYALPAQHFVLFPGDVGAILADSRRLRRLRNELQVATGALVAAETAVTGVAALPERLAADRAALASRLDTVEARLRRERIEGIIALVDFDEDLAHSRAMLTEQAAVAADAPLRQLDAGASLLEEAAGRVTALEAAVGEMVQARQQLDEQLRRTTVALDDAQAGTKAGPAADDAPDQVKPLLRQAAALLNESAADSRRRRDFAAAARDIDTAGRLIATGRDLAVADRRTRRLVERDDGVSLHAEIDGLRAEIDAALAGLGGAPVDAVVVNRAAELRGKAETLIRRQNEVIAALEREAAAVRDRVARAWNESGRLLALDDEDPLARRYERLMAGYETARRSPPALEQFRQDAAAFERSLGPWVARLAGTRERITRTRQALPEMIDEALATAAPWACLGEHVAFIQQRAADFETARGHFNQANRRRDAERLMDELEAIEREAAERLAVLKDQAGRLRFLEKDVDQIMSMASGNGSGLTPEDPDWPRRERALNLIAHHTAQAHAATRYEDASLSLARAADLANKLVL